MTVSAMYLPAQYDCDGIVTAFTFAFVVVESSDVEVILTSSGGTETVLTETTHYAVTPAGGGYSEGGTVTTVSTYASGDTITLRRNIPIEQESDFTEGMPALYSTFELALDYLTMICQQLAEVIERIPTMPSTTVYRNFTFPEPEAGAYLRTKADLTGYENVQFVTGVSGTVISADGFYRSTMTGDETVTVTGTEVICILDPNGADRNLDLIVPGDFHAIVHNLGPYMIVFDSAGIAEGIGAGEKKDFIYDATGACWI